MNHEHEQNHASSPSAATAQGHSVEPGQSSRSLLLGKPEHAVASRLVQRKDDAVSDEKLLQGNTPARHVGKRTLMMGTSVLPLFRTARPTHEEIAETALSGGASALPHRVLMEQTFGRSLDHVEAHTGPVARETLSGVGADGVTVGHRMAFREATPTPEVVAHELVHVLQHETPNGIGGSTTDLEDEAYAAERTFSRGEAIQVRGSHSGGGPHFRWSATNPPPDMQPLNWSQTAPIPGPNDPQPIQIGSNGHTSNAPPIPPEQIDWNAGCHSSHHSGPSSSGAEDTTLVFTRGRAWSQFRADVTTLLGSTWGPMTEAITRYNHAERDPTLQSIDQFQTQGRSRPTDVAAMANQQRVPRTGSAGTTVEDLFRPSGEPTLTGTDLQLSAAGQHGIDHASQDPATESALNKVRTVEARVQQVVIEYQAALGDVRTKVLAIKAAQARIQLTEAQRQAADAQTRLQQLEEERKTTAEQVLFVLRIAQVLLTSNMPTPISGTADNAAHEVIGVIANKIVDSIYEDRIRAATAALSAAAGRVRAAGYAIGIAEYNRAVSDHNTAVITLQSKKPAVVAELTERRDAYVNLSRIAASHSGGDATTRERLQAAIAAIPVIETVIARISDVQSSINPPAYTHESGIGAGMARAHGYSEVRQFVRGIGLVKGYQSSFRDNATHWNARLTSLQNVVHRLEALDPPGGGGR